MRRTRPRTSPSRRLAAGAVAVAVALALAARPAGGDEPQAPHDVEAAMLVNLVKFVTWPGGARPGGALRVCTVASARLAASLAELARRGALLEVVEVRSPAGATRCQVAVLGESLEDELEDAAERLGTAGALTVSASPNAGRRGVHVNFVVEGDRVRFEVNLAAARRAGFEISSKLLRLARVVEGGSP